MNELRNKDGLTEAEFLANYKPGDYDRPSVTVDMMVVAVKPELNCMKILLIQRKDHPCINCWALPGGFVNIDESAYNAACRELEEETGLKNVYLEQLYTLSQPDRDPRMRIIDIAYMALIPNIPTVTAGDDAADALWFDVIFTDDYLEFYNEDNNLRIKYKLKNQTFKNGVVKTKGFTPVLNGNDALAFDHAEIILEGLMRLRNKIMYSDIAFNLVPEKFTLPDLQAVYEIILGKELYPTNFKNSLVGKIEPLRSKGQSIVGKKASTLYRYKG